MVNLLATHIPGFGQYTQCLLVSHEVSDFLLAFDLQPFAFKSGTALHYFLEGVCGSLEPTESTSGGRIRTDDIRVQIPRF